MMNAKERSNCGQYRRFDRQGLLLALSLSYSGPLFTIQYNVLCNTVSIQFDLHHIHYNLIINPIPTASLCSPIRVHRKVPLDTCGFKQHPSTE